MPYQVLYLVLKLQPLIIIFKMTGQAAAILSVNLKNHVISVLS